MVAEVVDDQLKRKRRYAEEVQSEQASKKIVAHTALANKFYAIRTLNKQPVEWTVAQTKTMATWWYKRAGNIPLPTTKQLLLTRFHDTMHDVWRRCSISCNCCNGCCHFLITLWLAAPTITKQDMMGGPQV